MAAIFDILAKLRFDKGDADRTFAGLQATGDKLKDSLSDIPIGVDDKDAGKAVTTQIRSIVEWKKQLVDLKAQRDKAEDSATLIALNKQITTAEDEVKKLKAPIREAFDPGGIKPFEEEIAKVPKHVKDSESAFAGLKEKMRGLADIAGAGFIGSQITGGIKDFLTIGTKFDAGLKELSALTGVAGSGLDDLGQRARNSAKEMGGDASDNLTSYKNILSKLGPDIAKSPEALDQMGRAVATLSKATGDDAIKSVDALTTGLLQFQVDLSDPTKAAAEMTRQMNVLAAGAKEGAAEVPDVAEAIKVAGVAASGAKVSFEETNAAIQALAAGGKQGAEAGTALRNVIGKLGEGRFLPPDVQKELAAAKVDMSKLSDTTLPFTDRLRELNKISGDTALVTKLFGTENAAAASILIRSADAQDQLRQKITGTNAAVEQAAIRQESFQAKTEKLEAQAKDVAIGIFTAIQPILSGVADFATGALGFIGPVIESIGQAKVPLEIVAGGLATIVTILTVKKGLDFFGGMAKDAAQTGLAIVQKVIPALVAQTAATEGETAAQLGLNTAMLSSPIFLGLAAAVAVGVTAYAIFHKSTKDLGEATADVADAQKEYNDSLDKENKTKQAADHTRKLADEYDRLKKSDLPADQKRLADVTKELDEATQGAASTVDLYGNAVSVSTDAVRNFADAQERASTALREASFQNLINQGNALVDVLHDSQTEMKKVKDVANGKEVQVGILDAGKALISNLFQTGAAGESVAESIKDNSKSARAELGKFSEQAQGAQAKILDIVRAIDNTKNHQATVEDVISKLTTLTRSEALGYLATIHQEVAAQNEAAKGTDAKAAAAKKLKTHEEDLLALAKQKAELEAQQLEQQLQLKAIAERRQLTDRDQLAIAERYKSVLDAQTVSLLKDKKYEVKAKIAVNDSDIKVGNLTLKIDLDKQKLQEDLAQAKIETARQEVEVGIRPKFSLLEIIADQLDEVKRKIAAAQPDLLDPEKADAAALKIEQFRQKLAGLVGEQQNISKEISDANLKIAEDNAKNLKGTVDVVGYTKAQVLGLFNSLTTSRSKLSADELNDQRKKYGEDQAALKKSLDSGKLSREEYADRIKKIERDRAKFEADNDDSLRARLGAGIKSWLDQASSAVDKEVQEFIAGQLVKELEHALVQESMTASATTGTAVRIGLQQQEQLADTAATQSSLIGAVAKIIGLWSGTGPIGWVAGLASAAAMEAAFLGISAGIRALAFADGGFLGVVGEAGPEIVGPAKDFSQFASATIIATANAVERGLTERQGQRGGRQQLDVKLSGRSISRGRDIVTTLEREEFMSSKERFVRP